jgi:23S rRNA pseudouridine1911/1915/1917 synthase
MGSWRSLEFLGEPTEAENTEFPDDCAESRLPVSSKRSRAESSGKIASSCGGPRVGAEPEEDARASETHTRVPADQVGHPLDGVVRALFAVSWGEARRWIERGKIAVDGVTCTDSRRKVGAGAALARTMNAPRPRPATDLPPGALVFVDTQVVVVDKPSGISTVPYDDSEVGTLDERVRAALSRRSSADAPRAPRAPRASGEPRASRSVRPALGIVHRIDKETSGLVVFTRTWLAKKSLSSQFREHTVHRRYLAIAHGDVRAGTIRSHIAPDRGDGLRGTRARGERGDGAQLAITHVEVLERLQGATLVACRLETGRTHQIRVHLSEAGHPIVGERVYIRGFPGEPIPAPRIMLHAAELGFVHPATGCDVRWTSEPPADFAGTLARLRTRA